MDQSKKKTSAGKKRQHPKSNSSATNVVGVADHTPNSPTTASSKAKKSNSNKPTKSASEANSLVDQFKTGKMASRSRKRRGKAHEQLEPVVSMVIEEGGVASGEEGRGEVGNAPMDQMIISVTNNDNSNGSMEPTTMMEVSAIPLDVGAEKEDVARGRSQRDSRAEERRLEIERKRAEKRELERQKKLEEDEKQRLKVSR